MKDYCPAGNYSYGFYPNGSVRCRDDISGAAAESDPYWTGNASAVFGNTTNLQITDQRYNETDGSLHKGF